MYETHRELAHMCIKMIVVNSKVKKKTSEKGI